MSIPDDYHGRGGTYVVLPDGRRVPSDPVSGEPLTIAEPEPENPAVLLPQPVQE